MTTTNASNATVSATATGSEDTTITNAQKETVMQALRALHGVVASHGIFKSLPAFDACSEDDLALILGRTEKVLAAKNRAERAEAVSSVKGAVEATMQNFRNVLAASREQVAAQIATVEAATPGMATALGLTVPDSIKVPLFALAAAFPKGTSEATVIGGLKDLGYEVSRGQGKGKSLGDPYVKIGLEASSK